MNPFLVSLVLTALAPPPAPRYPALNVCLAVDRAGPVPGEKNVAARDGALAVLRRLGPADIVSVVAYDDVVQVLVSATRFPERGLIENGLHVSQPGGSTALFAGVVKCAGELRKFADGNRLNRIVVLSDSAAPTELGGLKAQLRDAGITVATVGRGAVRDADLLAALTPGGEAQPVAERADGVVKPRSARAARPRAARFEPARPVERRPVLRSIGELNVLIDDDPLGGLKL
jgi:secreted protein with Ig-like and vWFA domain